ncbi:MAG: PIG-L family deacetylase [Desulfuromonadaceae bacterium]|nr:PIG-L family deacetylase [Desulfuromonas sp.]MDY0186096.1 PIG-L family deacetylase [Desulfuromonadaceae bacterium]
MSAMQTGRDKRRKQKRVQQLKGLFLLSVLILLLFYGYLFTTAAVLVFAFLGHELLGSDHIFFSPKRHDQHALDPENTWELTLQKNKLDLPTSLEQDKTYLLKVTLKSRLLGRIFDPYVELKELSTPSATNVAPQRQYFERSAAGVRYLNITHLSEHKEMTSILVTGRYCAVGGEVSLLSFSNPQLEHQKLFIVAPHADDAELAAFALYGDHDSCIITLTAGEVGAPYYQDPDACSATASRLKGRLRAFDSVMVPRWRGVEEGKTVQLGYFCMTLKAMYQQQPQAVLSHTAELADPSYFRNFNTIALKSDNAGEASWALLLQDLQELLEREKSDIILTPHPLLDPHPDHIYATKAICEACQNLNRSDATFLLYANHYHNTDMFPFGPAGSIASVPPQEMKITAATHKIFSYPAEQESQRLKGAALAMMHDLRNSLSLKKKFRLHLHSLFLGRKVSPYGEDEFFRKAVRNNELFYVVNLEQLSALVDAATA